MSLGVLGLSVREERVYRSLLARGHPDIGELAAAVGLDPATCRRALDGLVGHRLLNVDPGAPLGVRARLPSLALAELTQRCAERLGDDLVRIAGAQAEFVALDELARDTSASAKADPSTALAEVVRGEVDILSCMEQLARTTRLTLDTVTESSRTPGQFRESPGISRSYLRGVRIRWIVHRDLLGPARYRHRVREIVEHGGEVRAIARPVTRLLVADRSVALVPDDSDDPRAGLVIMRHPELVGRLSDLFEAMWQSSDPVGADGSLVPRPGGRFGESERQLLRALAAYPTDEQAARALSISVRQLQRRIKDAFGDLGAVNRFHAGVLAARHGLIPVDDVDEADAG